MSPPAAAGIKQSRGRLVISSIVYGPVPSHRLGRSLGNIGFTKEDAPYEYVNMSALSVVSQVN
jgi:hypothetical protein